MTKKHGCETGNHLRLEQQILSYVLNEMEDRGILDNDAYDNMFGCKSYDEVAGGIKKLLKRGKK